MMLYFKVVYADVYRARDFLPLIKHFLLCFCMLKSIMNAQYFSELYNLKIFTNTYVCFTIVELVQNQTPY